MQNQASLNSDGCYYCSKHGVKYEYCFSRHDPNDMYLLCPVSKDINECKPIRVKLEDQEKAQIKYNMFDPKTESKLLDIVSDLIDKSE